MFRLFYGKKYKKQIKEKMNSNYKSIHARSEGFGSSLSGCSPKLNPFSTFRKLGEAYVYLRVSLSVTHVYLYTLV